MPFIHQLPDWPHFHWDQEPLAAPLAAARLNIGALLGRLSALGLAEGNTRALDAITADALGTAAIEGQQLPADEVRSSAARRLGLDHAGLPPAGRAVDGLVAVLLDATQQAQAPLTAERLCGWHAALFTTFAMDTEMQRFLAWCAEPPRMDPLLQAGLAHLWFVTVHPFEDGNGRIARAIGDLFLARADGSPRRSYSLSAQILEERSAYYAQLERTQRGTLDISDWLVWFLGCLDRAVQRAIAALDNTIRRAQQWALWDQHPLNTRQRQVLRLLSDDYDGLLNNRKYRLHAKCSADTALRDLRELVTWGVLEPTAAGGRSRSYRLAERTYA